MITFPVSCSCVFLYFLHFSVVSVPLWPTIFYFLSDIGITHAAEPVKLYIFCNMDTRPHIAFLVDSGFVRTHGLAAQVQCFGDLARCFPRTDHKEYLEL